MLKEAARGSYALVEAAAGPSYARLVDLCRDGGQKFPLLAHRLACARLQGINGALPSPPSISRFLSHSSITPGSLPGSPEGLGRGSSFPQDWLSILCRANAPDPVPTEWSDMHQVGKHDVGRVASRRSKLRGRDRDTTLPLLQAVLRALTDAARSLSTEHGFLRSVESQFDLAWYCRTVSMLHLNAFRVEVMDMGETHDRPPPCFLPSPSERNVSPPGPASDYSGRVLEQMAALLGGGSSPAAGEFLAPAMAPEPSAPIFFLSQ